MYSNRLKLEHSPLSGDESTLCYNQARRLLCALLVILAHEVDWDSPSSAIAGQRRHKDTVARGVRTDLNGLEER